MFSSVAFTVDEWGRAGIPVTGFVFAGSNMPKGAGAMPDHRTQVWLSLKRGCYLERQIVHHIQKWSVGSGLIGDQRSAKLNKDNFLHGSILSHLPHKRQYNPDVMSINAGIIVLAILCAIGALLAARAGIRSIQSARTVVFYRTRRARMLAGWQWLATAFA